VIFDMKSYLSCCQWWTGRRSNVISDLRCYSHIVWFTL